MKDKILYCIDAPTFLMLAYSHIYNFHREEDIVFLIDYKMFKSRQLIQTMERLVENGILIDYFSINYYISPNLNCSVEEYEQVFVSFFSKEIASVKYDINTFKKIYVFNDNWDGRINVYFNIIGIRYTWINTNINDLFSKVSNNATLKGSVSFISVMNKYKALSPFAKYADVDIQESIRADLKHSINKEYREWNNVSTISSMDETFVDSIMQSYETIDIKNNQILLLTNSYGFYLGNQKFAKSMLERLQLNRYSREAVFSNLHKTILDYYGDISKKVYVKTHPNDPLSNNSIELLYENKIEKVTSAPFEIFNRYLEMKSLDFSRIIGIASSSLEVLENNAEVYKLGISFVRTWAFYDSIYVSAVLAYFLGKEVCSDSDIKEQLENITRSIGGGNKVCVIDEKYLNKVIIINGANYDNALFNSSISKFGRDNILVFINLNYSKVDFSENDKPFLTPILIEKKPNVCTYNELIWVFSKSEVDLLKIESFYMEKELSYRNVKLKAYYPGINYKEDKIYHIKEYKVLDLYKNRIRKYDEALHNLLLYGKFSDEVKVSLKTIKNIEIYLGLLNCIKNNKIIILAVKDTPGSKIPETTMSYLHRLGFLGFSRELWKMYIGIIDCGEIVCDYPARESNTSISWEKAFGEMEIRIKSSPWKKDNCAEIVIDTIDYSCNCRGINIVVIDKSTMRVVDSANYDGHVNSDSEVRHLRITAIKKEVL